MANKGVEIKGLDSLQEFMRRLAGLTLRLKLNSKNALDQISDHLVARGKANAPILTGDLISGLEPTKAYVKGNTVTGGVVDPVPYAYEMHQFQVPWGILYNLGPRTAMIPKTEEGGPGGGYVYRVAVYHNRNYLGLLSKAVVAALEGKAFSSSGDFKSGQAIL